MKKWYVLTISVLILFTGRVFSDNGLQPMHLQDVKMVAEVSVSDNGQYVAYTLVVPRPLSENNGAAYRELYVYDISKKENIPLITGSVSISMPRWIPGTQTLCYRQNTASTTGTQLFTIAMVSRKMEQLTNLSMSVGQYAFRNANEIVFVSQQKQAAAKSEQLKRGVDLKIFEEELLHLELYIHNLSENKTEKILKGYTVFDFVISPDGSKIAAAVSEKNLVDYQYMFSRIGIIDIAGRRLLKTFDNPGKLGTMTWNPDNKRLAFVASAHVNDAVSGSLFVMNVDDKNEKFSGLTNLVKDMELSVTDVKWKDINTLYYTSEESTDRSLTSLNLRTNRREPMVAAGRAVFSSVTIQGEMVYFAGNTSSHPNELFAFDVKKKSLSKLSNHNSWLDGIKLARQEKISYTARDGQRVDGVLVFPLNFEAGKSYPLIVYIHGGPEASVPDGWYNHYSSWGQFAAARGFFVFSPNYRASSGRGVDYTMKGFGDLLGVEYDDVLDGIDYLVSEGLVDKGKVGIGGGSYGGYFAAWSATRHTERFKAAVVFVGISNQVSKRNTTDIPQEDYLVHWGFWTHENHDKVWNVSPVKYVSQSTTPTLILHGENDPRIPISQGLELYRGLKLHGKAPVRFVQYPGEGHGNIRSLNRYDYLVRTLDWFEYYLITNLGSNEMPEKYISLPPN